MHTLDTNFCYTGDIKTPTINALQSLKVILMHPLMFWRSSWQMLTAKVGKKLLFCQQHLWLTTDSQFSQILYKQLRSKFYNWCILSNSCFSKCQPISLSSSSLDKCLILAINTSRKNCNAQNTQQHDCIVQDFTSTSTISAHVCLIRLFWSVHTSSQNFALACLNVLWLHWQFVNSVCMYTHTHTHTHKHTHTRINTHLQGKLTTFP